MRTVSVLILIGLLCPAISLVMFAADVVVTDQKNNKILVKDAGFPQGALSGVEKTGVPLKQGSVRKTIPWASIKQVEILPYEAGSGEQRVRVTRTNGTTVEGELLYHFMYPNLVGNDSDGTSMGIPISEIKYIEPAKPTPPKKK